MTKYFSYKKIKINYKVCGNLEDKNKTTLLFVHGFSNSLSDWNEVISLINEKYNCIAIDLPGFGKSDSPIEIKYYSQDFLVELLQKFISSLKLKNIIPVGYSMGGRIVLSYVVKYHSNVKGVILESSTAGIISETERIARARSDYRLAKFIESHPIEDFVQRWVNIDLFESQKRLDESKLNHLRQEKLLLNKVGLINSLIGFSTGVMRPLWEELPNIKIPVLLISGKLDKKFISVNQKMKLVFYNATLREIDNCGHNTHLEKPKEFVKILNEFLETF